MINEQAIPVSVTRGRVVTADDQKDRIEAIINDGRSEDFICVDSERTGGAIL